VLGGETGIEKGGGHAQFAQGGDLVLHQRDQRRDHDGRARHGQRRHLVAQRLAAAGGHEHQRIAPAVDRIDHLVLRRTEGRVAEDLLKDIRGCALHGRIGPDSAAQGKWMP